MATMQETRVRLHAPACRTLAIAIACAGSIAVSAAETRASSCDIAAASPWINRWFAAWELVSREIMHLPDAPAPALVFYDSACVYTTSAVVAGGAPAVDGPALRGDKLPWRALPHDSTITLPDSSTVPVALMSFANNDKRSGAYFVMAAPSYWVRAVGDDPSGFTGVFLHEFAHTRQMKGMVGVIGPIDDTWPFPEELNDDAVQTHFASDSVYVAAYLEERDLLYRAADADTPEDARALAAQALAMMKARHARWFTGDNAVFAIVDDTCLSMEGAGQWAAYAWLAHPDGGGLDRAAAIAKMLGKRRWWSQDEGLALMLAVDRLLPGWPLLVFGDTSTGAGELLERAVDHDD
jgi:hypothetical protein